MASSLNGTSVIIFGGSSGMGLATAAMAGAAGARVTIAARDPERLKAAAAQIGAVGSVALDVADEQAVADFLGSFERIDHIASFAGTHVAGKLVEIETASLHEPVDSRFWGPVHICRHAAPRMSSGSITLCTASSLDHRATPGRAIAAAAAAGSEALARTMAVELAPIRVNILRPGIVDTPALDRMMGDAKQAVVDAQSQRLPIGRVARPEDIAHAAMFLMTNDYVTGATLTMDGGASVL